MKLVFAGLLLCAVAASGAVTMESACPTVGQPDGSGLVSMCHDGISQVSGRADHGNVRLELQLTNYTETEEEGWINSSLYGGFTDELTITGIDSPVAFLRYSFGIDIFNAEIIIDINGQRSGVFEGDVLPPDVYPYAPQFRVGITDGVAFALSFSAAAYVYDYTCWACGHQHPVNADYSLIDLRLFNMTALDANMQPISKIMVDAASGTLYPWTNEIVDGGGGPSAIPEPSTWTMMAAPLIGLLYSSAVRLRLGSKLSQ